MQTVRMCVIRFALAVVAVATLGGLAEAQSVELGVRSRQLYADVPFVLQVTASGFEESPEPVVSDFAISGAEVSYLGMSPSVRSSRTVINGQVTRSRQVRFVYSYRIEAKSAGTFSIPAITVTQDATVATSSPGRFEASGVANSRDMRIELDVPDRPVWIGESFDIGVSWYLRKNPRDQTFVIPLFEHPAFEIEAPSTSSSERLAFSAGAKELELPYESGEVVEDGVKYTRFKFNAVGTPTEAGRFELDAPRVVAKLQTGEGQDAFGFRNPRYELFKATGKKVAFEVKPLPRAGRPPSFSNAVGTGFSISVTTSRSVVSVGEPVELTVVLRGERGLEGLSLPPMIGEGRLDAALFDAIGDEVTGVIADDGLSKTFKVTVVLTSAAAREIPPIEFSYFDPEDASFKTTLSQPIALNVGGADMVGAQDVVGAVRKTKSGSGAANRGASFAGDLTPSSGDQTLRTMLSLGAMKPILGVLYALPLLLLAIMLWLRRTGESRGRSSELRSAVKLVEAAAKEAQRTKAETSAAGLLSAIKELGRLTGNKPSSWFSEVESLAFDPKRRTQPVPAELVEQALSEATSWSSSSGARGRTASSAALVFFLLVASAGEARAADHTLSEARAAYANALETSDRGERTRGFAATEAMYRELVAKHPDRPELLADWGNAALGAGDLGIAALAYRRALSLDRGLVRAEKNLNWIREQMPSQLVGSQDAGAVDSLFFWHRDWSLATRHLVAAIAFAVFILLLVPWGERFARVARRVAVLPLLLFLATLGSALLEPNTSASAVVVNDGQTLRTADSLGAPPAMGAPVPAGLEVSLMERRGTWTQISLPDGKVGWLASSAVETVQ